MGGGGGGGEGLCWSSNGAELRILYCKQFFNKRCGTHKNWWFSMTILENK